MDVVNDTMYRGGELKDCVILVRNGKEGAFVADYLIEYNKRENILFRYLLYLMIRYMFPRRLTWN